MDITFSGNYAINTETFGINFEANVDGRIIICTVSVEALQDVNPENFQDNVEQQFIDNRSTFESIAVEKILAGAVKHVFITSADVHAY